jgi:hypothetical protein
LNTESIGIGRRVTLHGAPGAGAQGSVIDFESDDPNGNERPFPYLIESDDHTTSWHRWFELALI